LVFKSNIIFLPFLENPENKNRYRDLDGDDPDQEALEAKIQVLEERLNNKKVFSYLNNFSNY